MKNAHELADAIGRKDLSAALGVGMTAISNAVVRGWFPSSWFVAADRLAHERGFACPPELFGMRAASVDNTQNVDAGQVIVSGSATDGGQQ